MSVLVFIKCSSKKKKEEKLNKNYVNNMMSSCNIPLSARIDQCLCALLALERHSNNKQRRD